MYGVAGGDDKSPTDTGFTYDLFGLPTYVLHGAESQRGRTVHVAHEAEPIPVLLLYLTDVHVSCRVHRMEGINSCFNDTVQERPAVAVRVLHHVDATLFRLLDTSLEWGKHKFIVVLQREHRPVLISPVTADEDNFCASLDEIVNVAQLIIKHYLVYAQH